MRKSVIGLMSGTSMDGIDGVLMETDGENYLEVKARETLSYVPEFRLRLKAAEKQVSFDKNITLNDLAVASTKYHIQLIEKLLLQVKNDNKKIDLIGYHGQTMCHRPSEQFSLQIGDPQFLANHFKIPVVFDFRGEDLRHGGQGAPLAPLYHQALMIKKNFPGLVMINCGGIANISIITGNTHNDIQAGFDTGPGNVLIDRFVREWTNNQEMYDKDGAHGLRGKINQELIEILFNQTTENNFYDRPPPKSLDSNDIKFIPEIFQCINSIEDGCCTLAAFTAYTIRKSLDYFNVDLPPLWVISGGGAKNPVIMNMLKYYLSPKLTNINIQTADAVGFNSTYLEAELMAWLAVRSIKGLPLTLGQTTGTCKPVTGGTLFQPIDF